MSNIFYNIEPKVINTELACLIGLNEAIVLQQLHYWLEKNKQTATNFNDGRFWTYGTIQEYRDRDFRFWSFNTVKRTLSRLVEQGFLIKGNYNKMKLDQTTWYSIDYVALERWIVENSPMEQPNVSQSSSPIETSAIAQNEPLEQTILSQSTSPHFTIPSAQNEPLHQPSVAYAIPENKKQTIHKRLDNKTNSQRSTTPTAVGESEQTQTAISGEIVEPAEILFDEFWKLYPRKESKAAAKKAWLKLKPDQALFDQIANALEYRSQTKEWLAESGRYIPHPATWLNGRRWEDELTDDKFSQSAILQEKYGDLRVDGKPLDPVQKKQLEYIEKQLGNQKTQGGN